MRTDEITNYLDSIERDSNYCVQSTLKESEQECTQKVYFIGHNGAKLGPYIRKYINCDLGLGKIYQKIYRAQKMGKRFKHLPMINDCYIVDTNLVVIMEYICGETLYDLVYRLDPSFSLAIDLFPRICDAVLELHTQFDMPIIHRDIKPTNIMVNKENIWIIDLGIARVYQHDEAQDTQHFGSVSYAPPEQFGFGQTDVRSDVYSLAALLYFLLKEKQIDASVTKCGFADVQIPVALQNLLAKATQLDPNLRYKNVEELKQAFLQAIGIQVQSKYFAPAVQAQSNSLAPKMQSQSNNLAPRQPYTVTQNPADYSAYTKTQDSAHYPLHHWASGSIPLQEKMSLDDLQPRHLLNVWRNIGLLVLFLLLGAFSIDSAFNPPVDSTMFSKPLGMNMFYSLFCWLFIFAPTIYMFLDRNLLRKWIKLLAKIPKNYDIWLVLSWIFFGTIIVFIVQSVYDISMMP